MISTPQPISIIFLGSFLEYSAAVLQALYDSPQLKVAGVVTTPAKPAGRKKILKKTDVHLLAEKLSLPIFSPEKLDSESLKELGTPPQILVTAGYGKLLPDSWLEFPTTAALNLHFSLLPAYRGANPAEWALLRGEQQTGISIIKMAAEFDTGGVIASASYPISKTDTRETIYQALYKLGGETLPQVITDFVAGKLSVQQQPQKSPTPYAKRFSRDDSFIDWRAVTDLMQGKLATSSLVAPLLASALSVNRKNDSFSAADIERATRALLGFPGLWTMIPTAKGEKRMKMLETAVENEKLILKKVQIAGQDPAVWNQVKTIISNSKN